MGWYQKLIQNLPEVAGPTQKRLGFKEKLKWTLIILVLFFVLGLIPLFGLGSNALTRFEYLSIILGAKFGSIVSLGIGPLVTSSIVLQLLNGSGLIKFDLTTSEGKKNFQGTQKLLSILFVIFEAMIYVKMGGLSPLNFAAGVEPGTSIFFTLELLLIFQLVLGGILIMFMDEVVSRWGFGSGISLFIAAGVCQEIFLQALNWFPSPTNPGVPAGKIPGLFYALANGDPTTAMLAISAILATVFIFVISVYAQALKVEIPLSFGRIRGHGIRWPLSFIYTSNIPVILIAALMANIQLWARLMQNAVQHKTSGALLFISQHILGQYGSNQNPISGLIAWMEAPNIMEKIITSSLTWSDMAHAGVYLLFLVGGSVLFSIFWVQTAGMDARSQAKNMMAAGLQIPGFRKDERVMERLLDRYIMPLTVMGAITVGLLAGLADLLGALSRGTGILLTVMIIYKLYEEIAQQHMMDMNPAMRKFMGGS